MEITTKSKINGTCDGLKKDRVFEFFNGAKWRQIADKSFYMNSLGICVKLKTTKNTER